MKFSQRDVSRVLVVTSILFATTLAQAYFVRPGVSVGNSLIDGYEENGSTIRMENFTTTHFSKVDLTDGTIRNRLEVTGPRGFGSSFGVFGDRLTFLNAEGKTLSFSFAIDGNFSGPAVDPNLNSTFSYGYRTTLYVFDSAVGATYLNFDSLGGQLVKQDIFKSLRNPAEVLDLDVQENLSGSFTATSSRETVDIFASVSVFFSTNENPGTWIADFENTGRFGIQTESGVTYTSESGVFLGSGLTPAIPEPSTYAMLMAGLLAIGFAARRGSRSPG